jgi:hypothetical protein
METYLKKPQNVPAVCSVRGWSLCATMSSRVCSVTQRVFRGFVAAPKKEDTDLLVLAPEGVVGSFSEEALVPVVSEVEPGTDPFELPLSLPLSLPLDRRLKKDILRRAASTTSRSRPDKCKRRGSVCQSTESSHEKTQGIAQRRVPSLPIEPL